jgi:hypothetical protein
LSRGLGYGGGIGYCLCFDASACRDVGQVGFKSLDATPQFRGLLTPGLRHLAQQEDFPLDLGKSGVW